MKSMIEVMSAWYQHVADALVAVRIVLGLEMSIWLGRNAVKVEIRQAETREQVVDRRMLVFLTQRVTSCMDVSQCIWVCDQMVVCGILGVVCSCKVRIELSEGLLSGLRGVVEQEWMQLCC